MSEQDRRDWLRAALGSGIGLLPLAAAATTTAQAGAQPAARPQRLGLVLGAGTARGLAHIGVLKSLAQAGIQPDVVVGCSAGALIGAFYAAGVSPWQIEEVALRTKEAEIVDLIGASNRRGLLNGETLARFVNDALRGAQIEGLRLRYAAVATDLRSGDIAVFRQGPVSDAVRASCSMPGVFVPNEYGGRELVDGGLVAPVPVKVARQMGADTVIAVDVGTRPNRNVLPGLYEVLLQSFEIMGRALANHEVALADFAVRPDTSLYASSDFSVRREMIQVGYETMQRQLPALRKLLEGGVRVRRG